MSRRRFEVPEAAWDAWAVTKHIDGPETPATEQELLQRGLVVLARADGIVHVMGLLIDNSPDGKRYAALGLPVEGEKLSGVPEKAWKRVRQALPPEAIPQVFVSLVARSADGLSFREEIQAITGRDVPPGEPAREVEVVDRVLEKTQDPAHPAELRTVKMADIQDGDVVISVDLPPFRIQGEAK